MRTACRVASSPARPKTYDPTRSKRGALPLLLFFSIALAVAGADVPRRSMGYRPPTPEERAWLRTQDFYRETKYIAPNDEARARWGERSVRLAGEIRLQAVPAAVDLTATGFLPPVGDQGRLASCASFAITYYCKTYQEAREHGWVPTTSEHQMSTAFTFNLRSKGYNGGSSISIPASILVYHGCATLAEMSYNPSSSSCSAFPSEAAWREAILYRGQSATRLLAGDPDALIAAIKQQLANGDPLVTGLSVSSAFMGFQGGDGDGYQNDVFFEMTNKIGGHAVTIVGYDDQRAYYDGSETRHGAFKIVNSWGTDWGVSGFAWLSYDLIKIHMDTEIITLEDRNDYHPTLLGEVNLRHSNPYLLDVCFGRGDPNAPIWARGLLGSEVNHPFQWLPGIDPTHCQAGAADIPLDEEQSIVLDLSDGYIEGAARDQWFVWIMDGLAGPENDGCLLGAELECVEDGRRAILSQPEPKATRDPLTQGGEAVQVPVDDLSGLAFGNDGTLYLAENHGSRLRCIHDGRINDFAGTGMFAERGIADDGMPAVEAAFDDPYDLAVDGEERVFFSDRRQNALRMVDSDGRLWSIPLSVGGRPRGLGAGPANEIFIAVTDSHKVFCRQSNGTVALIAGTGEAGSSGDGEPATEAKLCRPMDVAANPLDGSIYIADQGNWRIRRIDAEGIIQTVCQMPMPPEEYRGTDFYGVRNLAFGSDGTLYFLFTNKGTPYSYGEIYKMVPEAEGPVLVKEFPMILQLRGLAVDGSSNIYVGQTNGPDYLFQITPAGQVNTIVGVDSAGYGNPVIATFNEIPPPCGTGHWFLYR